MSRQRLVLWLGLLALVLVIRWWDPMGRPKTIEAASGAVERVSQAVVPYPSPAADASSAKGPSWPVRSSTQNEDAGNAFLARGQVPPPTPLRSSPVAPPAPVAYVPPPPPPPTPPPLQIIGTWGDEANLAVFVAGPQGTVLARQGEVILSDYRVQSITTQQLTLLQNSSQRTWNLPIPAAPSTLQTWPGR